MKFLIWFLTLLILQIVNTAIGQVVGVQIGQVLLFIIWFAISKALCKGWENHKIKNEAKKGGISPLEVVKNRTPSHVRSECENLRGNHDALKAYLKQVVSSKDIPAADMDYLLEEYMKTANYINLSDCPHEEAVKSDNSNSIRYCRKCGAELVKGAKYCKKCGTEIAEIQ